MKRTERAMRHSELVRATSMTARLDANGQLEPIGVDEVLTTTLFAGRAAPDAPDKRGAGAAAGGDGSAPTNAQAVLFELA